MVRLSSACWLFDPIVALASVCAAAEDGFVIPFLVSVQLQQQQRPEWTRLHSERRPFGGQSLGERDLCLMRCLMQDVSTHGRGAERNLHDVPSLAEHDYHNQRMSNVLADSFDTFGNSRLANGQPTFHRLAARLSPDRQADIQRRQKSETDGEEGVRKTTWRQLLGLSDDGKKSSWRDRQGMGKQREKARRPTVDCHSAAEGCQGCHGYRTLDWSQRLGVYWDYKWERVLREVNEGGDGQKEKHHPLTRSLSFCLQLLSECVEWAIHPDLEIMSCVLITKRPYAAAKRHCLHSFWCHRYLKGSRWTQAYMFGLSWTQRLQYLVFLSQWTPGTITQPPVLLTAQLAFGYVWKAENQQIWEQTTWLGTACSGETVFLS